MKSQTIYLFALSIIFLLPLTIHAEESEMSIALGKFFNHQIKSLVFKQTPYIMIFESDVKNSGTTYIPNPLGTLRPIGPLSFIDIPARVLVNLSNYVFDEVENR